jgi:hypothetical protein
MSKKDYIALAKLIKENRQTIGYGKTGDIISVGLFIDNLCQYLKSDNPNFNESKFREACGE